MANHACIAIGINRYQYLQPLSFASADAQSLQQFWTTEANLPAERCLLLTDASPLLNQRLTYPSRSQILEWLEVGIQDVLTTSDRLLFFFSGYGVSSGTEDYLLPIDGNPNDLPGTGISVRSLLELLRKRGTDKILVLLDMNRAAGSRVGAPVGENTAQLAREMGIATILSSEIDQFSHESAALGNGLFTTTLLEALRYYHPNTTLENLEQYLGARLPELSEHHWRPPQVPVSVISATARRELIFPTADTSNNTRNNHAVPAGMAMGTMLAAEDFTEETSRNGTTVSPVSPREMSAKRRLEESRPPSTGENHPNKPAALVATPKRSDDSLGPWWKQLLLWGGGAILLSALMIAAVIIRNRDAFIVGQDPAVVVPIAPAPTPQTTVPNDPAPAPVQEIPASPVAPASPIAQSPAPAAVPTSPPSPPLPANQAVLNKAKTLIQSNQASGFSQAIATAQNVRSGDPLYEQAQQDILRWSRVILDIAEGRAAKGNFGGAIAAAQLVPTNSPAVYNQAQQAIAQWKPIAKQQQNNAIIQEAKKQIQPSQASSYNRAITTLRKIAPGQPGAAEARQLITQWSQNIYLIANSRAARRQFAQAVQTAALVPSDSPSYSAAQKAIARWKQGQR
ncbi:MAG: caspase family protein [Kastovskya adunca ATA6-11-RM4]|jgi:hypothetical protein|nr:caspase family protein [Kastovskya adunca ATA6-11-RM4]